MFGWHGGYFRCIRATFFRRLEKLRGTSPHSYGLETYLLRRPPTSLQFLHEFGSSYTTYLLCRQTVDSGGVLYYMSLTKKEQLAFAATNTPVELDDLFTNLAAAEDTVN